MKRILYFSAPWCGPCKTLSPIMDQLQAEGINIEKINVDNRSDLSQMYSVRNVPTLILVDGVKELKRLTGVNSKDTIKNWYNG